MIPPQNFSRGALLHPAINRGRFDKSSLNISKWRFEPRRFYDSGAENVGGFGGRPRLISTS
jgi:hypothetical protein